MRPRRMITTLTAMLVLTVAGAAPAHAANSITDRLAANGAAIEVTSLPASTSRVEVAYMPKLTSGGSEVKYRFVTLAEAAKAVPGITADPVLDVQAFTSASRPIGNWAGRLKTIAGGESQAEKERREREVTERQHEKEAREREEREHLEEPPREETFGSIQLGLNAGYWGSVELPDLQALAPRVIRLDTPSGTASWEAIGLKVIADMSGPYSSSGVSGVNISSYVARDVALVKGNPGLYALETLNEPGGSWFWGGNSESSANREAYARLVIAVHNALVAEFGARRPLQLCSMDGGHDSSDAWGEAWTKNKEALNDCDLLTNHPYGGTGTRSSAILGNRSLVERTYALTGKQVAVTEVGFPTKGPTGDSLQYTETEEASAIYHFDEWAAHTGHVGIVTIYNYRDEGEGGGYGVETHAGAKKRAYTALKEAVQDASCTVCS